LNSIDERPESKVIGFRWAVVVRGVLLARKESILGSGAAVVWQISAEVCSSWESGEVGSSKVGRHVGLGSGVSITPGIDYLLLHLS
jgi:hypothetical protein